MKHAFALICFTLLSLCYADRLDDLITCVGGTILLSLPSDTNFQTLVDRSFKSNFKTPLVIAEASNEAEVSTLVKCARRSAIRVCARSGGHSFIGHSLCRGLVIDLNRMRSVSLNGSIATIEPGAVMGEVLWHLYREERWLAAGNCPQMGFTGYVLGGGHGPYEESLGITCDSMVSARMVDRMGEVIEVSASSNAELFWAICGAGGGQFGIVTEFKWHTVHAHIYGRAVGFRFKWPKKKGGEVIEKWQDFDQLWGRVWTRIEVYSINQEPGISLFGACYDVGSVDECVRRLQKGAFFNVAGRTTEFISMFDNALDAYAFFGPEGDWGRKKATNIEKALLGQRWVDSGAANERTHQSTFLRRCGMMDRKFWQRYVNFCQSIGGAKTIPWIVCQMTLFNGVIDLPKDNAFAFRNANMITQYIIGGGNLLERRAAYNWMKDHLKEFTLGGFVNYPELELQAEYASAYWGSSLARLTALKMKYDPNQFFMNPQPIPT